MKRYLSAAGLLSAAALFAFDFVVYSPGTMEGGDGATVINFGRDGRICNLAGTHGHGTGIATVLANPGGRTLFLCAGALDDPSLAPVSTSREDLVCITSTTGLAFGEILFTKSGRFAAICHGEL